MNITCVQLGCFTTFHVCPLQSLSQEQLKDYSLQKASFKKEDEDSSGDTDSEDDDDDEDDDDNDNNDKDEDSSADGKDSNLEKQKVCKVVYGFHI
jgi:hypothetical protein